jgi:VanZ family protein
VKRTGSIVVNWGPVILWMIVIFIFSTEWFSSANTTPFLSPLLAEVLPAVFAPLIEGIVALIRKLSHWSEYFILAILLMRALKAEISSQPAIRRLIWSIVLATLYAASDEFHQSFVPSRTANPVDVVVDSFGAFCGTLWCHLRDPERQASLKSRRT